MKKITLLIICLFSIFCHSQTNRYVWRYTTSAHKLLKIEENSESASYSIIKDFDEKYKLLDNTIDKCEAALKGIDLSSQMNRRTALRVLKILDFTLSRNGYAVCVTVEKLSSALTLKEPGTLNCIYCDVFKDYREQNLKKLKKLYHVDCDLYSLIHLSVGEALKLPISFVEVPKHNFVRWNFADNTYINWDVNTANEYLDDDFRLGRTPTVSQSFTKEEELKYHYLKNMSEDEIFGYYYYVLARNLKSQKKYVLAKDYYLKSINLRPSQSTAKLSLAYMIVFVGAFNSEEDYKLANELAKDAYFFNKELNKVDMEIIETYTCSLALLGKYEEAMTILKSFPGYDVELYEAFKGKQSGVEVYKNKHDVLN